MQVIAQEPGLGTVRVRLAPGETLRAAPGSVVACSYGLLTEARLGAGVLSALARAATGADAAAVLVVSAPDGGWVELAPTLLGEAHVVELGTDGGWCLARGAWLASPSTVELVGQWGGSRALFGADGGFLVHADGIGPLVLACGGAARVRTVLDGEYLTVHATYLVGYPDGTRTRLRPAATADTGSMRTGDGYVLDVAGPATVLTQTRSFRAAGS